MRLVLLSAFLIVATACNRAAASRDPVADTSGQKGTAAIPTEESEWKAIEQLEAQAKSIARIQGCSSSSDCRTVAIGSRGCGGPRSFIPYCARTTDSAALFSKAAEITEAEKAYNKKYQIGSTCEMRMAPAVVSEGGSCVAR